MEESSGNNVASQKAFAQAQTPKRVNTTTTNNNRNTISHQAANCSVPERRSIGHANINSSVLAASTAHGGGGSGNAQMSAKRMYRAGENKWVTRDIASLDFLLGIPLAAEQEIVATGWQLQLQRDDEDSSHSDSREVRALEDVPASAKGTWWEKWVQPEMKHGSIHKKSKNNDTEAAELEQPTEADTSAAMMMTNNKNHPFKPLSYAPGRRLEGDEAVRIQIPLTVDTVTKQRSIARQAALREWELETAHGLANTPPLLDGRLFFSANSGYPVSVFSIIRYEPKKEEAAFRRRKLEAIGGGGSQFVLPNRDWRGISYRALLRRSGDDKADKKFNRFVRNRNSDAGDDTSDDTSTSSSSSDDSNVYVSGLLDDPGMVLGRHRTVMIGDRVTGPIVSSTIQFVKPALLKAELNKQFRERFDGWEPPKSARKYIGAKVIQGNYVLIDPTEEYDEQSYERRRNRQGSVNSLSSASDGPKEKTIRMPPSLTLSKIRSLKSQVLQAAVRANLEIGTVALACVYFERLCLDCRVDKSNRRLTMAACLLLAAKLNEPNVVLVMRQEEDADSDDEKPTRLQSLIRPNKRSNKMFASLLLFFTQDWSLSLKHLFTAEWGVFAALGFSLDATPSQIAFHFKRLMKTLEWSPLDYLGSAMYSQWQDALAEEEERRVKRERRLEVSRKQKEERLLNLHIEIENEVMRRKTDRQTSGNSIDSQKKLSDSDSLPPKSPKKKGPPERRMKLFNFGMRRSVSTERMNERGRSDASATDHRRSGSTGRLPLSPSTPTIMTAYSDTGIVAIDIPYTNNDSDASSIGLHHDDEGIII